MTAGSMLELKTPDGPMELFEARPAGTPSGGVIVLHGAEGLIRSKQVLCELLADAGLHAVAPALFHRSGASVTDMGDLATVFGRLETDAHVLADAGVAADHLRSAGLTVDRIAVVGFCYGGRAALLVALRRAYAASVSFYGTGIVKPVDPSALGVGGEPVVLPALVDEVDGLQTPWLAVFAADDFLTPPDEISRLRDALVGAPVEHAVETYPGVGHGFVHAPVQSPDDLKGVAADAWQQGVRWITRWVHGAVGAR